MNANYDVYAALLHIHNMRQETKKDIDELVKKYKWAIRGLSEVATDEKGRKLLDEATKSMGDMYKELRDIIANQHWQIIELGMALEINERMQKEHKLLVDALNVSVAIDEMLSQTYNDPKNG